MFHSIYSVKSIIGRGNFASVFKIINNLDNKLYAVKTFNKNIVY